MDHHTLFSDHWGLHLELTPVELGRFVDWSNGEGKVGIANPAEVVRPALAAGFTTGRPNVPIFLGLQGWLDPKLEGEDQHALQGGVSLLFSFYVPLFDIN